VDYYLRVVTLTVGITEFGNPAGRRRFKHFLENHIYGETHLTCRVQHAALFTHENSSLFVIHLNTELSELQGQKAMMPRFDKLLTGIHLTRFITVLYLHPTFWEPILTILFYPAHITMYFASH
jgi:hypothetical protein